MKEFNLQILAEDRDFYEGKCVSVTVPMQDGEYGIMFGHSNAVGAIVPGTLRFYTADGKCQIAAISYGVLKIENNEVLILADTVERPEEIDEARARRKYEEAREALLNKQSEIEYNTAQTKLARAINRLKVKKTSYKI